MRSALLGLVMLAVPLSIAVGQSTKKQTTIYGEVVDIVSYVTNGMKPDNPDRKALAEASAKAGNPLGILERNTGKIYVVVLDQQGVSAAPKLVPFFGLKIFAVGRTFKKGGVQLFVLSDIGKSVK